MNKAEAKEILLKALEPFRATPYVELKKIVEDKFNLEHTHYEEVKAKDGETHQIRVNVYWDDKKSKTLRVVGSIDDGGWRAMIPLCEDFIIDPAGRFIGE